MRAWIGIAAVGLAASAALAQPAQAPPRAPPPPGGYTQVFISPCGEPWRAGPGEPYPLTLWFKAVDTSHDGAIDLEEFRADHLGFFDALDQNHDGVLDGPEISFYEQRVAPDVLLGRRFGALQPGLWGGALIRTQLGTRGNGREYAPDVAIGPAEDLGARRVQREAPIGASAFGLLNDAEPVSSADSNLDGRVSRAEFQAAADRRFKRLDRNADGKLTLNELPKPQAEVQSEAENRRRR